MTELELPIADVTYMMRRLAETRRIPGLTPALQFDMARLPIDDNALEDIAEAFGAERKSGWGFSDVLERTLSQTPEAIPATDLKEYQERLKRQGYVDPDTQTTGVWDPMWAGAARRQDRDAEEAIRAGHSWSGGPVEAGVRFITNTLPSAVWQGIVGTAKGLVQQTPETVGRVGLVGGAAAGAAIGAVIGGGVGAIPGAIAGGAIGFLGDLLGGGEDEENQSGFEKFVDALQPFNEYAGNARGFWEDLGYVGSAAAMISGAKMAIGGAQVGAAAIRAGTMGSVTETLPMASRAFPGSIEAVTNTVPVRSTLQSALMKRPPTLPAGLTAGEQFAAQGSQVGVASRLTTWALSKPLPGTAGHLRNWVANHGLMSQQTRLGVQLVNKLYTGPMAAQLGSRFAAGFTGPRVSGWQGTTTIEKAIAETEPLGEGTIVRDLVDLASFLVVPERFLPWAKGSLPSSIDRLAGTSEGSKYSRLFPFAHVTQKEGQSFADATREVMGYMTPEREMFHRLNYGITQAAYLKADQSVGGRLLASKGLSTRRLVSRARFDIIRKFHETIGRGDTAFADELVQSSFKNEGSFVEYLTELSLKGSGIDRIKLYDDAESLALRLDRTLDKAGLVTAGNVVYSPGMTPGLVPTGAKPARMLGQGSAFERIDMQARITRYGAEAAKLRAKAGRSTDPNVINTLLGQARQLEDSATAMKNALKQMTTERVQGLRTAESMRIAPMRLDSPTRADFLRYRDEYLSLRQASLGAWKVGDDKAKMEAFERLQSFTDDLIGKGVIPRDIAYEALGPKPTKRIADFLKEEAQYAARDIVVDEPTMKSLSGLGYKPVLTGEDVVFIDDVGKLAESYGTAEYSRKAALIETLGFSPRWRNNIDTYQFRVAAEESEFQGAMKDFPISGKKIASLLHGQAERINGNPAFGGKGATIGPFTKQAGGGSKLRLYLTDLRDLTVEDIYQTPGLQELPGFTMETAQGLFRAIRRSAALGGEVKMLAPVHSMRVMGKAMRVNGLPGFSDAVRTWHTKDPAGWGFVKLGAATGAGVGAWESHKQGESLGDNIADALKGAALGAGFASPLKFLAGRNYGYLPDRLVRVNTALRFSLSLTFDAGRYMEQNMIAHAKYNLPFIMNPRSYIKRMAREGDFRLFGQHVTDPEDAWKATVSFWDEVNGTSYFRVIDDVDRRMFQRGLLAFSPRDWEAAQAVMLYQQGMKMSQIRDAVSHIGRYGPGRTAAEKSANFIFFPFSFSKKLLSTLGDFMIQAPARALLLHEGHRRYTESTLRTDVGDFLDRHLPLLQKLWTINNLSYGLSPGRFFLSGLMDNRTALGNVMFTLGTAFVPSGGAATTAAQMAGAIGDLGVQAFSPIVVTGESIKRAGGAESFLDILKSYVPFTREINTYFFGNGPLLGPASAVGAQLKANPTWLGGEGLSPYSQYQDYVDELREYKNDLEPLARVMGYASADGLLNSDVGLPMKMQYEQRRMELRKQYPTGSAMSDQFENSALQHERAIQDIVEKVNKSEAEEAIVKISQEEWKWRMLRQATSLPSEMVSAIAAKRIRDFALKYANDRRFRELWEYLYAPIYGPVVTTKVV